MPTSFLYFSHANLPSSSGRLINNSLFTASSNKHIAKHHNSLPCVIISSSTIRLIRFTAAFIPKSWLWLIEEKSDSNISKTRFWVAIYWVRNSRSFIIAPDDSLFLRFICTGLSWELSLELFSAWLRPTGIVRWDQVHWCWLIIIKQRNNNKRQTNTNWIIVIHKNHILQLLKCAYISNLQWDKRNSNVKMVIMWPVFINLYWDGESPVTVV